MAQRKHFSLTASTHSSVTITAAADTTVTGIGTPGETYTLDRRIKGVTVVNHSDSDTVYYRWDGSAPTDSGGDDDWALPPRSSNYHGIDADSIEFVLVSTGTPKVSLLGQS
jgi:hypothetical protein